MQSALLQKRNYDFDEAAVVGPTAAGSAVAAGEASAAKAVTKVKANSVKQEYEKQDELKRSAMRAVAALMNIPGADKHPQLNEFLTQIKSTPELANLFESIQKDSGDSNSHQMDLS